MSNSRTAWLNITVFLILIVYIYWSFSETLTQPGFRTQDDYLQASKAELSEAIKFDPENIEPYKLLADTYLIDKDLNSAIQTWRQAMRANPTEMWPIQNLIKLYDKRFSAKQADKATIDAWKELTLIIPDRSQPYLNLARAYAKSNKSDLALDAYQKAVQVEPEDANAHFALAAFLHSREDYQGAIEAYQQAALLEPDTPRYQARLGQESIQFGEVSQGVAHLEQALLLDPSSDMHNLTQKIYSRHLTPNEHTNSYLRVIDSNPDDELALNILVQRFLTTNQCKLAVQYAVENAQYTNSAAAYLRLAHIYHQCNDSQKEVEAYEKAIEIAPYNLIAYIQLGQLELNNDKWEEASELFIQAIRLDLTSETFSQIIQIYLQTQEHSLALSDLLNLLEQAQPTILQPYEELIQQYKTIGQSHQESPILRLAAEAMPHDEELQFRLADALYQAGKLDEAIMVYSRAVEQQPNNQTYQLHLGRAQIRAAEIDSGSEIFQQVLSQEPTQKTYGFVRQVYYDYIPWPESQTYLEVAALAYWEQPAVAYNALGNWYTTYGYPKAALDAYTKAMQSDSNNPTYPLTVGKLHLLQGNFETADTLFAKAVSLDESPGSFRQSQTAYLNQWPTEDALQKLTALLEQAQPSIKEPYHQLAQLYQNLERYGQSIPVWEMAINSWPADGDLQFKLAQVQEQSGDLVGATSAYQQAVDLAPNNLEYRLSFGLSLLMNGQYKEGTEVLSNALLRQPNNQNYRAIRDAYKEYIQPVIIDNNETDDETDSKINTDGIVPVWRYQEEIARIRWPNPAQAYPRLAKWFTDNGQPDAAAFVYEKMIEAVPTSPIPYLALGQFRFDVGDTESASELFTQAIARDAAPRTYRAVQNFYLERLSVEESLNTLQSLIAEALPPIKQPYLDLIKQYQIQGLEDRSIPVLQSALQAFGLDILPQDADLYYQLAEALYEQDEIDAAIGAYRRAATMQPQNQPWQIKFGRALLAGGHIEDGIRNLKNLLASSSGAKTYNAIRSALHEAMPWPDSQPYQEEIAQIYWTQFRKTTSLTAYQQLATWYQKQGLLDGAIATYQSAVDRQPNDLTTRLELGKLQFRSNDLASAHTNFEQAVALDQTPIAFDTVQKLYMSTLAPDKALLNLSYLLDQARPQIIEPYDALATLYATLGDPAQRISIYESAVTAMPDNAQAVFQLAQASEPEESVELYRRALTLQPTHQAYGLQLGTILIETEEIESAAQTLEQALRATPNQTIYESIRDLYAAHLPAEDASIYQNSLALIQWPQAAEAYSNLARWYVQQSQLELALDAYEQALEIDSTRLDLYIELGKLYFEQDNLQAATQIFTEAIAADQSPMSFQKIQTLYTNNLKPDLAFSSLLYLLTESKPAIIEPYSELIQKYEAVGLSSPKPTIWQLATEAMPDNSDVRFQLAEALYEDGQVEQAIERYNQSLALQPQNQSYRLALGRALLADEQIQEGASTLQVALRQRASKPAYDFVRETYQELLGWPQAENYQLQAALIRWPNLRLAYQGLAGWYQDIEQPEAAIATYQQVLAVRADSQSVHQTLADIYLSQSMCPEASYHATQFATLADNQNSYRKLAGIYAQCGPQEAAAVAYQRSMLRMVETESKRRRPRNVIDRALLLYPPDLTITQVVDHLYSAITQADLEKSFAYSQLGWYLETNNQAEKVLPLYKKAVQIEPTNANNHFALARLYHELGQAEDALPEYQRALALNLQDPSTYLRYGRALVELGQYEQGQTMLENGLVLDQTEWGLNYVLTQYLEHLPPSITPPYIKSTLQLLPISDAENYVEIYMQPVRFYLEAGDINTAVSLLEMAAAMNTRYSWPYVKLSYVYRGQNQSELALNAMQKASIADPKDAWIHLTLGNMLRRRGRLEDALYELRQATQLAPEETWHHIYLGHGLIDNDEIDKGITALQIGLELESTEEVFAYVDKLYMVHLTPSQIMTRYELIVELRPDDAIAQRYLDMWREKEATVSDEELPETEPSGAESSESESSN